MSQKLRAGGGGKKHMSCACHWATNAAAGERTAVLVVPRLVSGLLDGDRLRSEKFEGTVVPATGRFVDVFTGEEREGPLRVDQLFSTLPVALLLSR